MRIVEVTVWMWEVGHICYLRDLVGPYDRPVEPEEIERIKTHYEDQFDPSNGVWYVVTRVCGVKHIDFGESDESDR